MKREPHSRQEFDDHSKRRALPIRILNFLLLFSTSVNLPLSSEEWALKKQIGAHPQSRERWGQQEKVDPDPTPGLGTQEIPGTDGEKDKIYYSITTPEEEKKARQEEKEKEEKSWNMLNNVIIDRRGR